MTAGRPAVRRERGCYKKPAAGELAAEADGAGGSGAAEGGAQQEELSF